MTDLTFYAPETPEEIDAWRKDLRSNLDRLRAQHRGMWLEHRAKERELRIVEGGDSRAAKRKPEFRDNSGRTVTLDMASQHKQSLIHRVGELERDMQGIEIQIEEVESELKKLPDEEPEEGEAFDA